MDYFIKYFKKVNHYYSREARRHGWLRYILLILIIVIYFIFTSLRYGTENGLIITLLTWSFFVFCTPIADAGFLIDFPIRLLTGIKMVYSEIIVSATAAIITILIWIYQPQAYDKTLLLRLFKEILSTPLLWVIIALSTLGTFLSVYFGDEIIDKATHERRDKHLSKYKLISSLIIIILTIVFYNILLNNLQIKIPLF